MAPGRRDLKRSPLGIPRCTWTIVRALDARLWAHAPVSLALDPSSSSDQGSLSGVNVTHATATAQPADRSTDRRTLPSTAAAAEMNKWRAVTYLAVPACGALGIYLFSGMGHHEHHEQPVRVPESFSSRTLSDALQDSR